METKDALRGRRAVRDYVGESLSEGIVRELIEAATLAPSEVNVQPWAFVVVQDEELLKRISDLAKFRLLHSELPNGLEKLLAGPDFNIFYNASTLILICAKPTGMHPDWDCCLAGQNLMLAARDMGLGSCVIGFAWAALELDEIREELEIPNEYIPVLPIIVGHPKAFPPHTERKPPEILSWKTARVAVGSWG